MRQVSSSYSLLLPCHSLVCCILSCHHVHCIITFSKLASVRVLPISSILRSKPNHTCTRPRHVRNIILLVAGKCSRNGLKVGMWCRFVVSRPPAKFHRIRSPFDAPTDNYSGIIVGQTSDVFGLRKRLPGCLLSSPLSPSPSTQTI